MLHLVLNSLRFYWRSHIGVLLGVTLATAVLTGALLVGDSVDHSLRSFAMMRLGEVDSVANTRNQYFKDELADVLETSMNAPASAVLQLSGMVIRQGDTSDDRIQVNRVEVLGVAENFWAFTNNFSLTLGPNETALNEKLATALQVQVGDEISMRVAKPSLMSRDAPLSWSGDEHSTRRRFTVTHIVPDTQLGRFSLKPSQIAPYNAFVNRDWLQEQVELEDKANLLLLSQTTSDESLDDVLREVWKPEYIGLSLRSYPTDITHPSGILQLESERVFLSPETARAALRIPLAYPTLTYLVSKISHNTKSTPYSFAVAGPVPLDMQDDEIVLNRWTADELSAGVGDSVDLIYAELQSDGAFLERTRSFRVHSIREMADLETERELMPHFPGLSDVESCADWDVGMPMDDEMLEDEANEAYWNAYRATPKCFVTLRAGQSMWSNRFGNLSAVRYPGNPAMADVLMSRLQEEMNPANAGLSLMPVREQALNAVNNAMDFGGLFLGMSIFLIGAALLLTALLFGFGVQQRSTQMGTLLALGFTPKMIRRLLLSEGFIIALVGCALGAGLGALYTRALLFGLSHFWQGAIAHAAIQFHATPSTYIIGVSISFLCAMLSLYRVIRGQSQHSARELLTRDFSQAEIPSAKGRSGTRVLKLSIAGVVLAFLIIITSLLSDSVDLMMPFFSAASLLLISSLGLFRELLIYLQTSKKATTFSLSSLALQNLARRRGRSLAVVGLLACGSFMVFAVGAMQEDIHAKASLRSSGTGGFALLAESTLPIQGNLLEDFESSDISATAIKVRDGDDASCLNLNRAQTPRVLGVNAQDFSSRSAFAKASEAEALWALLDTDLDDGSVPALVGDMNTAMWNLMKKTHPINGDILLFQDESGEEVKVRLVGALPMRLSVFQGTILIANKHFTRLYPSESGHRMFLIDVHKTQSSEEIASALVRNYDRAGMNAMPTVDRIMEFYAVETTYLAMFLVLGGLGLAIGSIGMGVVIVRNLLERQSELAMLSALGFERKSIYRLLLAEYGFLLLSGLFIGVFAAFITTLPTLWATASSIDLRIQATLLSTVFVLCGLSMLMALYSGLNKKFMEALRRE